MELIVEHVRNEWRCDLHDAAHSVLVTASKEQMEVALDYLEATGRLKGFPNGMSRLWLRVGAVYRSVREHTLPQLCEGVD